MQIELTDFYSRLGTIALILALGFFLGKAKIIDTKFNKTLVNLLLMVFMPASLFVAFPSAFDQATSDMFFKGMLAGAIVMFSLVVVSRIVFNKYIYKGELRYESQFAFIFNNATFLGYPIIASTFGQQGIIPYCGFIIAFNIALFSYGVFLFQRKVTAKLFLGIITNPNIIAVVAGMVLFMTGFKLPSFVMDAAQFTGNATTALSVICIGFMLSHAKFLKLLKKWRLILTAIVQLVLGPLITYGLLRALSFPDEVVYVCTLIQALPTATSLGLFAAKYGGNDIESSELVTISTALSLGIMPLMVWLLLIR
jgi:predicted permease